METNEALAVLNRSAEGREVARLLLALVEGPVLDGEQKDAVANLLVAFWGESAGTVLDGLRSVSR